MLRKAELMNKLMHGDMSVLEQLKKLMEEKMKAAMPEASKPAEEPSKEEESSDWKKKKK